MSDEHEAPREPAPDRPLDGFPTAPTEADYRDLDRAVCAILEERYPGDALAARRRIERVHVMDVIERDWSVHPGEILRETLDQRGMTQTDLAALLGVSQAAVSHLVTGTNGIGATTALKLERALGISARFWLHLQADHDLYIARERAADAR